MNLLRLTASLTYPGLTSDDWMPGAAPELTAPVTGLRLESSELGLVTAYLQVTGDHRTVSRGAGVGVDLRVRDGNRTGTLKVSGLAGRGGARVTEEKGTSSTELSASNAAQLDWTLPELAAAEQWAVASVVRRPQADGSERVWEIRTLNTGGLIDRAIQAIGGSSVSDQLPDVVTVTSRVWVVELVPGETRQAPPYSTLGKTVHDLLAEIVPAELGYRVIPAPDGTNAGMPVLVQTRLDQMKDYGQDDGNYVPVLMSRQTEVIDYANPSAIIVEGGTVRRDRLTGLYLISPEMSGDPSLGGLQAGGDPPTDLTVTAHTATTVNLNWSTPAALSELRVSGSGAGWTRAVAGTSVQIAQLEPGLTYRFEVRGVLIAGNLSGRTAWSAPVEVTLDTSAVWPAGSLVITEATAQSGGARSVRLSWSYVPGLRPALVRIRRVSSEGTVNLPDTTETSVTDTDVPDGTVMYELTPVSAASGELGAVSGDPALVFMNSSEGPPAALDGVSVQAVGSQLLVNLSAVPQRTESLRVLVMRGAEVVHDTSVETTSATSYLVDAAGLSPETSYTVWVYPENASGRGEGAQDQIITPSSGSGGASLPQAGTLEFELPSTLPDGSSQNEVHTVVTSGGRVTSHRVVTSVDGQKRAAGDLSGAAQLLSYSGLVSDQTTTYTYGISLTADSRLTPDAEDVATVIETVDTKYGPSLQGSPPSLAQTLLSTETTREVLAFSPSTGYLSQRVLAKTVSGGSAPSLSGDVVLTETHLPIGAGRWLHGSRQTVSRLVQRLDASGVTDGFRTDQHTTSSSRVDTTAPTRLPWSGDQNPHLVTDDAPLFKTSYGGGGGVDQDLYGDVESDEVQFRVVVPNPGGQARPLTIQNELLFSLSAVTELAQAVAARLVTRRRVTSTYRGAFLPKLTDDGLISWSASLSRGLCSVTVVQETTAATGGGQ